jgi:tetratricopeptide (TPR) repeat protein
MPHGPRPDATTTPDEVLGRLRAEVARHDPDDHPVQHATACFHLGSTLLTVGRLDEADEVLERAAAGFSPQAMPVEHAKATVMLGVARRDAGRTEEAVDAFTRAAAMLAAAGNELEAAASRFNAGLALRDAGDERRAAERFTAALRTFTDAGVQGHAAAAARELGASLLALGELDAAVEALERAVDLARRAGDRSGLGTAANVLGIVHLAAGRADEARAAFEDAAGGHPRAVRPAEHAMALANLALACRGSGRIQHARLAARQALAIDAAEPPVVAQARVVLDEVGDDDDALFAVLDATGPDRWPGIFRAEQDRVGGTGRDAPERHARAVTTGLARRPGRAVDLAAAWLEVLLERRPAEFEAVIVATVRATGTLSAEDAGVVRAAIASASARFHVPQLLRLRDTFVRTSEALGEDTSWG